MALTDNCDLFISIHEDGVNQIIHHIMRQRPSLFNYATSDVIKNKNMWCSHIDYTQDVQKYGNPIFTIQKSLPILGADSPPIGLNFCVQVVGIRLDFEPSNIISLPSELNPPLEKQRFALMLRICGAIGCPSEEEIDAIPVVPPTPAETIAAFPPPTPIDLQGKIDCFCMDVFTVGHFEHTSILGKECLLGKVDDIEIVDIKPESLEKNIECYLKTTINVLLRQKLSIPMENLLFEFPLYNLANIILQPSPDPPIKNNPAIEENQLKVFIDMEIKP